MGGLWARNRFPASMNKEDQVDWRSLPVVAEATPQFCQNLGRDFMTAQVAHAQVGAMKKLINTLYGDIKLRNTGKLSDNLSQMTKLINEASVSGAIMQKYEHFVGALSGN